MALASIHTSTSFFSSSYVPLRRSVNGAIHVPKTNNFSVPKIPRKHVEGLTTFTDQKNVITNTHNFQHGLSNSTITMQLYAILDSVSDRIEMHNNLSEQRQNWNNLLLNNINMITLTATTLTGVAAATGAIGAPLLALKLSSTLMFSAATGLLLIMNKIQPSQLAEEQRNATRLFKQLRAKIENGISLGNITERDVKCLVENVLALDKAYPLPLLGVMLEKFPEKYEPAVWWPGKRKEGNTEERNTKKRNSNNNGWSEELEMELKEVIEVVKRKDIEDYERLGNMILKINKSLAIAGPLLTGVAAIGSTFVGNGSIGAIVAVMAGSLGAVVNAFEHGGQIGMVFEMYRNCGGFFKMLEESVDETLEEKDYEMRENGELFEMKMALMLGRSVCEMRQLALKSASCRMEGIEVDEFASKLF